MIDTAFRNINSCLFFYSKTCNNDPTRDSFDNFYMLSVEIKDFNALLNNKPFSDHNQKAHKQNC